MRIGALHLARTNHRRGVLAEESQSRYTSPWYLAPSCGARLRPRRPAPTLPRVGGRAPVLAEAGGASAYGFRCVKKFRRAPRRSNAARERSEQYHRMGKASGYCASFFNHRRKEPARQELTRRQVGGEMLISSNKHVRRTLIGVFDV